MAHLINRVTIGIANNTRSNYSENHAPDYNYTYTGPAPKRVAGKEQKYHFKIKKKKKSYLVRGSNVENVCQETDTKFKTLTRHGFNLGQQPMPRKFRNILLVNNISYRLYLILYNSPTVYSYQ